MGGFGTVLKEAAEKYLPKLFSGELTDDYVRAGEATIRKMGPYGDVLVDATKKWQDTSAQMSGEYYANMLKLTKPFMKNKSITKDFATHWQNYAQLPDGALKDAITSAKTRRLQMYRDFMQSGIKVGPLVADDWPRMYPRELFEGVNRRQAIETLTKSGLNARQAEGFLDRVSGKSTKAYNYEAPRKWDLPGYRRDMGVLFEDIDKASKRLNFVKTFGPNEEVIDLIMGKLRQDHGSYGTELARKYLDNIFKNGQYYKSARPWEQGLASLQVATKLGLAVLSHTSQPLNLAVFAGVRPMVRAMGDLVNEFVENGSLKSAEDFSLRSGSIWTESMRRYRELYGTQVGGLGSKLLHATGFVSFDKYRRIYASVTGRYLAEDLFADLSKGVRPNVARERLGQLGIDAEKVLKRGYLDENDLLQAAKRTSDVTQFTFDANQLPLAWKSSPMTRLVLQFKQYFYTQANFMKDFAVKPAFDYMKSGGAAGDIRPLIYTALLFPSVGEITADLREYARKGTLEERPQLPLERVIDNLGHAGAFGIFQDLVYNVASPSDAPIWHFVAGPTISDLVDLARLPHTKQPIGLEMLRRIPAVGPYAAYKYKESTRKRPRSRGILERGAVTKFIEKNLGSQ